MNEKQIIPAYDDLVRHDQNFDKMIKEIARNSKGVVLEPGPGTGLLTKELLQKGNSVVPIEISTAFIVKFKENLPEQEIINADALHYREVRKVDSIALSLVWHHIEDGRKEQFLRNMHRQLKEQGRIIIGDVFLLPYKDESERDKSLHLFHEDRISQMKDEFVKKVERQTLKEGLARDGEYKTSEEVLRSLLVKAGFSRIKTIRIGEQETGGYRVVIAEKVSLDSSKPKSSAA